jgi:acyl-coenzyme A synthetase/AMP-(fatty) acid ligase
MHVVLETREAVEPARLEAAAQAILPPNSEVLFHVVPALPRNHMGKVSRLQLKQLLDRARQTQSPS